MTEQPKKPYYRVALEPGRTYSWCVCGKSQKQPFCDGSHAGTGLSSIKFTVPEAKEYALCGCKATKGQPYCDGTHKTLPPSNPTSAQ